MSQNFESDRPGSHRDLVQNMYRRIDWLSHYQLLGVDRREPLSNITTAFRKMALLFDPRLSLRADLADCDKELRVVSERLQRAFKTLSDAASRAHYDAALDRDRADPSDDPDWAERSGKFRVSTAMVNAKAARDLMEKRDFFPAIQLLEEAVRFTPDDPDCRFLLAQALLQNRLWRERAFEQLEAAARLAPARWDVAGCLAEEYLVDGRAEDALPHSRRASNTAPASEKEKYRSLELRIEAAIPGGRSRAGLASMTGGIRKTA